MGFYRVSGLGGSYHMGVISRVTVYLELINILITYNP